MTLLHILCEIKKERERTCVMHIVLMHDVKEAHG